MKRSVKIRLAILASLAVALLLVVGACAPTAAPTPSPTKAPAASPTAAPKAEPTKPAAAAATTPTQAAAKPTTAPATSGQATVKVRFGSPGLISDAGALVAMDRGYFKEQGIETELAPIAVGTDAPTLLSRGDLEVAGSNLNAGLINAMVRGIDLRMVADKGSSLKGFAAQGFVVRKDLAGQIKTAADLKGKNVGLACTNCYIDYILDLLLKQANLTLKDVNISQMSYDNMMVAFANKSIDVGGMGEPNPTIAADKDLGVYWKKSDEMDPGGEVSEIIISDTFAKNTDLARRWVTAYVKGLRDYLDAFVKNKGKAEMVALLAKYSTVKDLSLYDKMVMPGFDPDGRINADSLIKQQEFFVQNGGVKDRADLKKVIDNQFVDYAVQKLGPYK